MNLKVVSSLIGAVVIIAAAAFYVLRSSDHFPILEVEMGEGVGLTFLFHARDSEKSCQEALQRAVAASQEKCPKCKFQKVRCEGVLEPEQSLVLSEAPLKVHSVSTRDPQILVRANNEGDAKVVCEEIARQFNKDSAIRVRCWPPGVARNGS